MKFGKFAKPERGERVTSQKATFPLVLFINDLTANEPNYLPITRAQSIHPQVTQTVFLLLLPILLLLIMLLFCSFHCFVFVADLYLLNPKSQSNININTEVGKCFQHLLWAKAVRGLRQSHELVKGDVQH